MKRTKKETFFDNQTVLTEMSEFFRQDLDKVPDSPITEKLLHLWKKSFGKKFLLPGDNLTRKKKSIDKFLLVNSEMRDLNSRLPHLVAGFADVGVASILQYARELIYAVLGAELPQEEILLYARSSSGATVGVSYKDTSLERKWKFPISYCGNALTYILWLAMNDQLFWRSVLDLNGEDGDSFTGSSGFPRYPRPGDTFLGTSVSNFVHKLGSNAATVPKTNEIDRFICVEPTLNMVFQQGLAEAMWTRMEEWGLSRERDPEKHRRLAWIGSVTNRLATIDFESMSDRVSIAVVRLLYPAQWYAAFMDLRSPRTNIDHDGAKILVENHMISSMGNATTFPIETLTLWALSIASYAALDRRNLFSPSSAKEIWKSCQFGTFGDDVILPTVAVGPFLKVCSTLGFVPNAEKSYWDDSYFRESCGGDFLHGRDVRPLFLKAFPSPRSKIACEAHLYTMINRVITKYISCFGPLAYVYDRALLRYLFKLLLKVTDRVKFVPEQFPEDSGVCHLADSFRLAREYKLPLEKVTIDKHGVPRFKYLRWRSSTQPKFDDLRYAVLLKQEYQRTFKQRSRYNFLPAFHAKKSVVTERTTREFGKYVNATYKPYSCSVGTALRRAKALERGDHKVSEKRRRTSRAGR
jgi:hypothetical protein